MRNAVLLLALLPACSPEPAETPPHVWPDWSDADRVGTTPDFYERVPRNLLMISVDTFRKDHLDHYSGGNLDPFLSQLAGHGFTLDDHTQCSNWTFASTVCTLRGAYNVENGFIPTLSSKHSYPVPDGSKFLSHWLSDAGFYTILVSGNAWLGPTWNSHQGYDEAVKPKFGGATELYWEGRDRLLAAKNSGKADRWFLHLHLMEPHAAYRPPAQYLNDLASLPPIPWDLEVKDEHYDANSEWNALSEQERSLLEQHMRIRYKAEIRYFDDQLETIFYDLAGHGLLEDTLVVIWNDHGEQFWEHGYQSHAYTLHTEENDAWAIFWAPNIVPERWTEPTASIDIVPTLLDLWDVPIPSEVTGLPVGQAPPDRPRFATSVARLGVVQMVRKDALKMTYNWSGAAKLFDTDLDPLEQDDLFARGDERAQELWSLLEPYAEAAEPLAPQYSRFDPPGL